MGSAVTWFSHMYNASFALRYAAAALALAVASATGGVAVAAPPKSSPPPAAKAVVPPPPVQVAPPPVAVEPEPAIKGYAVAIGGGLKADNDEVWGRIVQLAGGKGARFVVFGTASGDPEATAKQAVDQLHKRGAVAEALPVAPAFTWVDLNKVVRDPALIAKVRAAKGVFFTGGLQESIVDVLAPGGEVTPMLEAIWDVYRKGGVVAGTSAGAAIMSKVMFRDAPNVINILKGRWADGKQVDNGLGFVGPDLFVDQHFLKRGRFGRMVPLMWAKGYKMGLGVDENTAAVVRGHEVEIVGDAGALLVDLNDAESDSTQSAFNIRGARISYLEHGDRFHVKTRLVTPAAFKLRGQLLDSSAPDFKPYHLEDRFQLDMLGDQAIANAMRFLIDSNRESVSGLSFEVIPKPGDELAELGFLFRLSKGPGSLGWSTDEFGGEEYTVVNIRLDITPVRLPQPLFSPWTGLDNGDKKPTP